MDLETIFSDEEKAALSLLVQRGFAVFTEAKLEDVKELDGSRRRTFRNQGRYDLVLALRKAEALEPVEIEVPVAVEAEASEPVEAEVPVEVEAEIIATDAAKDDEPKPARPKKGKAKKSQEKVE